MGVCDTNSKSKEEIFIGNNSIEKIKKAICTIKIFGEPEEIEEVGFFIKYDSFAFLVTNYNMRYDKEKYIGIIVWNKFVYSLNLKMRYKKIIHSPKDLIIFQIFPFEMNENEYFEYDINYSKGFNIYLNQEIICAGFFNLKDFYIQRGFIQGINGNEFYHNISIEKNNKISPIFLSNTLAIIGFYKPFDNYNTQNTNIGNFFGDTFNEIKKEITQKNSLSKNTSNITMNLNTNKIKKENKIIAKYDKRSKDPLRLFYNENNILNEDNTDIYINGQKITFDNYYNSDEIGNITVLFQFKKSLTSTALMFSNNNNLSSVDLSSFDESNLINMQGMFKGSEFLFSIDFGTFNGINVNDMSELFCGCFELYSLNCSYFNTEKVTNMESMFARCGKLTNINSFLNSFNTKNVTNMKYMFEECGSLESIDLSSFNTSNVTDMRNMFYGCYSLGFLDLFSFDTKNVTNMNQMFAGCAFLEIINVTSFNIINVKYMSKMFYYCKSLQSINLSSFDSTNVIDKKNIFTGCKLLSKEYIKISEKGKNLLDENYSTLVKILDKIRKNYES